MFTQLNQYHLVLEVAPQFQQNPNALDDIYVRSTTGRVPLSAFTHFEPGTAPLVVNHQGQFPAITVSFNLAPDDSLGDAVTAIDRCASKSVCRQHRGFVSGNRRRHSSLVEKRAAVDLGGAGDRVYRAGHSLRKLYPSDHDSFDPAVGRHRRVLALMICGEI